MSERLVAAMRGDFPFKLRAAPRGLAADVPRAAPQHKGAFQLFMLCFILAGFVGCQRPSNSESEAQKTLRPPVAEPTLLPEDESAVQLLVGGRDLSRKRLARAAEKIAATEAGDKAPASPNADDPTQAPGANSAAPVDMTEICNMAFTNLIAIGRQQTRRLLEENNTPEQAMENNLSSYDAEREVDRPMFVERCLAGPPDKAICAAKAQTLADLKRCGPPPKNPFEAP